jgi:hypothetical protein
MPPGWFVVSAVSSPARRVSHHPHWRWGPRPLPFHHGLCQSVRAERPGEGQAQHRPRGHGPALLTRQNVARLEGRKLSPGHVPRRLMPGGWFVSACISQARPRRPLTLNRPSLLPLHDRPRSPVRAERPPLLVPSAAPRAGRQPGDAPQQTRQVPGRAVSPQPRPAIEHLPRGSSVAVVRAGPAHHEIPAAALVAGFPADQRLPWRASRAVGMWELATARPGRTVTSEREPGGWRRQFSHAWRRTRRRSGALCQPQTRRPPGPGDVPDERSQP